MNKKTYWIINSIIFSIFLITFLFETIPIPVENIEGSLTDKYIFGGFYWTSGIFQITYGSWVSVVSYLSLFPILIFGNKLLYNTNK